MFTKLRVVLAITIAFLSFSVSAQQGPWQQEATVGAMLPPGMEQADLAELRLYSLDLGEFQRDIDRTNSAKQGGRYLVFPNADGQLQEFRVHKSQVFSPALAAKYPAIQSFVGTATDGSGDRLHFSYSPKGLQAVLTRPGQAGFTFIQQGGAASQYLVYQKKDLGPDAQALLCMTAKDAGATAKGKGNRTSTAKLVDDQTLRSYRIAVSASGEYTEYHGGTVAGALAAINATLTTVNAVFEKDLAVQLQLVDNTDLVIYTDPSKDPYGGNLNSEVQTVLTNNIGENNYDVGHLFHQGDNAGNAGFIGSVCRDNQKGSAYSSATDPLGPVFDLDFVGHELGHQFGANHTWSFENEGTIVQAEPGSGSTIMGYAGIVPGNNVQSQGDDYFHYYSIEQILEYLKTTNCATLTTLANNPPAISPLQEYFIPKGTPFLLTASASDPDAEAMLTYAWEQIDNGVVTADNFGPDNPSGANFRSRPPIASPTRYFPRLEEVVAGNLTQTNPGINTAWETLSNVERDLNFALTVRDNQEGGGQVASELTKVKVVGNAGPFRLTSQENAQTFAAGSVQTITWEVANTNGGVINAQEVSIHLSLDGGLSFPIELDPATPNDGSAKVQLPGFVTNSGRFMVRGKDQIFFALNASDFTITEAPVVLDVPALEYSSCSPDDLEITFNYEAYGGFSETSVFSAENLPAGANVSFNPGSSSANDTPVTMTLSNTAAITPGTYEVTLRADAPGNAASVRLQLQFLDGNQPSLSLQSPADQSQDVSLSPLLEWSGLEQYSSYELQLATDAAFTTIVASPNLLFPEYRPVDLMENTTYYWRVRGLNECGAGPFSNSFEFSTITISCKTKTATNLPLTISENGTPVVQSSIIFNEDLPISDLDITLDIEHSFVGDLVVTLESPAGTTVTLLSNTCGEFEDVDAVFDDEGIPIICSNRPAISGTVRPLGSLAAFDGESLLGEWVLTVSDTAPVDGGSLNGFSMNVCVEGAFRPDADGDGVFDDGDDLCPDTPAGTAVDTNGCPVYRFAAREFRVSAESESCRNNNDGQLRVLAETSRDYEIQVQGNGLDITDSFRQEYALGALAAGTYELCISGTEGQKTYQAYCFQVLIAEPEPLSVIASLGTGATLDLLVTGPSSFYLEHSGAVQQLPAGRHSLSLNPGANQVKIYTDLACQGSFEQDYYIPKGFLAYPNPFRSETVISLDKAAGAMDYAIFAPDGRLVTQGRVAAGQGFLRVQLDRWPSGLYLVELRGHSMKRTLKIVKQ